MPPDASVSEQRRARTIVATAGQTPAWSPDGAWLAYVRIPDGVLVLIRPDGSGMRIVRGHGVHPGVSWSPDSRWIIGVEDWVTLIDSHSGTSVDLPWQAYEWGLSWRR